MLFQIPHIALKKIAVVRGDNIGDWIFTIPTVALLRERFPQAEISVLGKKYIEPVVRACPYVDHFVNLDEILESENPAAMIAEYQFDLSILIQPPKIAHWFKKAKIPYRIGALNRMQSWFNCTHLPWRSNRKHFPHESQKTTQFLKPLGIPCSYSLEELTAKIVLEPKGNELELDSSKFNLVLHPGSNHHGREWPIRYYKELIEKLPQEKFQIFVTGTKEEREKFTPHLPKSGYRNLMGETTLDELILFLSKADGIVASGTGILHLGAALGLHAIGLFPPKFKMGTEVWQPLGKNAKFFRKEEPCALPCSEGKCPCMDSILPETILRNLQSLERGGILKV